MDQVALNARMAALGGYRAESVDVHRDKDIAAIVSKVARLIEEPGMTVTYSEAEDSPQATLGLIIQETPELLAVDNHPARKNVAIRNASVLEKLVMYLQLENAELRSRQAQDRIDTEKAALKRRHTDLRNQIDKNIKAMKEAAHQALLQKILGWVAVGLMVIAAVVTAGAAIFAMAPAAAAATTTAAVTTTTAATTTAAAGSTAAATTATTATTAGVATAAATATAASVTATAAGLTSAWGIARTVVLCVTAAIALANQILTETGTMKKLQEKIAETIRRNHNLSEEKANLYAQIILAASVSLIMLGGGAFGGKSTAQALKFIMLLKNVSDTAQKAMTATSLATSAVMGIGSLAQQGVTINAQYEQGIADATVTEVRAMLQLVEQMLEETQEELQLILEEIQSYLSKMFDVISSQLDAEREIADKMGAMA